MGNTCLGQSGPSPVILHIYDAGGTEMVKNVNTLLRAVGTGAFHTGVELYGKEWSFGFTNDGSSGIFSCPPRSCKTHRYREAVPMGETPMSQMEVEDLLMQLASDWRGGHYDVLRRNCTHFSEEFCRRLGVGPLPHWVGNIVLAGRTVDIGIQRVASFRSVGTAKSAGMASVAIASPGPRKRGRGRSSNRHRGSRDTRSASHDGTFGAMSQELLGSMKSMHQLQTMHTVASMHSLKDYRG